MLGFLICSHVYHIVGYLTVHNLAVWSFNETEWVHTTEGCQGTNQTNVWTFRRFNWAHTSEVGLVYISNFHGGAITRQTTRTQSRKTTLIGYSCQWIVLIHELRQLRSTEELLNSCCYWTNVQQGLRSNCFSILSGHTFTHNTFHTRQTSAQLVLNQLTHLTDTTISEVINIVYVNTQFNIFTIALSWEGLAICMQADQVLNGSDNVFTRQRTIVNISFQTKLLINLVTTNASQIVTLGIEVEGVKQVTASICSCSIVWTNLVVQLNKSCFLALCLILLQSRHNQRIILESGSNLGISHANSLQEDNCRLLTLTIDTHAQNVVLIDFKLKPCTTAWNNLCAENFLIGRLHGLTIEVHTWGTY